MQNVGFIKIICGTFTTPLYHTYIFECDYIYYNRINLHFSIHRHRNRSF